MNGLPSALNLFSNPLIRRFRRSQMRPVRLGAAVVITLVIAGFITTFCYLTLKNRAAFSAMDAARTAFIPLLIYQAIILGIFGTAAIGSGILRESEEGMIEYQRLTPLSPLSKVLGYLFGLPIRQYVAFAVTACFSAFSIIVGEIPFHAWGSVYLVLFTSTILYHLLALVTGLIIKSRWRAGLISLGLVIASHFFLPQLEDFGFPMFSHLSAKPVVYAYLSDFLALPHGASPGWSRWILAPDIPFWNLHISHLTFTLLVEGSLIVTFTLMLVRRWRDEEAHLLGKGYAVGWLLTLQIILLGSVLPLVQHGRIFVGMFGMASDLARQVSRMAGPIEALILAGIFGTISLSLLLPIIPCLTPQESTQMVAFRQKKKFGWRHIPWLADGATAAPFVWLAAIITGGAWALFMERLCSSHAYGLAEFPMTGWAVFIGIVFVLGAIFHFLLETYGRRLAWMVLFLAGFVPLLTSFVVFSSSRRSTDIVHYLTSLSPLSAPFQPLDWLRQMGAAKLPGESTSASADFGPFALFCAVHGAMFLMLFGAWRRQRRARQAKA